MSSTLKTKAQEFLNLNVLANLPANARRYTWRNYLGEDNYNTLGGVSYLAPCEGTVVARDNEFTLVKTGRTSFDVISTHLLSTQVNVGDKLAIKYHQLRRFDGTLADGSEDPAVNGCRSFSLTGAFATFPVTWENRYLGVAEKLADTYQVIQNPYLRDLIMQIEQLSVSMGVARKLVSVLIDAGASKLTFVDPTEAQSCDIPPAIAMHFAKAKFADGQPGDFRIEYDRAMDTYTVIKASAGIVEKMQNVHFPDLPEVIVDALDDGTWAKAQVTVLKRAPVKREKREPVTS